ncbi:MAG: 4-hydroxythreonine-4-phosphate dehydrogenase PdxA [Chthoniobacterales bacterium]
MRLAITLGDPAGIGPEVVDAALDHLPKGVKVTLLGRARNPGEPDLAGAQAAWDALEEAAHLAIKGKIDAIVTGPVSKHQLHQIGYPFPGQTEFFAVRSKTPNYAMCLTGGNLTVALVTAHIPLRHVTLTTPEIIRVSRLLASHLRRRGIVKPAIAIAGFNPHAGENGDLGTEEIDIIAPAVAALQKEKHASFAGPFPPDTIFHQAAILHKWDGVVCMYHDQGLIPLKLHAFDEGVNVTLGLPFVRTSPDHGTAFDIAGKGIASPKSMIAALHLAIALATSQH